MNILMCVTDVGGAVASSFEETIRHIAGNTEVCRNMEALQCSLRSPWRFYDMAILFAGNSGELEYFISVKELLEGIPVLLVLPERTTEVCRRAHLLSPRFLSFTDSDFSDFAAVLHKMMSNRKGAARKRETA